MRTGAPMENQFDTSHWIGHTISLSAVVMTIAGLLPAIAALAAVIWYGVQIYESNTVQKYLDKRRMKRKAARIAKLRAEQKVLLAELEALDTMRGARAVAESIVANAQSEATTLITNQKTHEKIHDGGKTIKSTPAPSPADPTPSASGANAS